MPLTVTHVIITVIIVDLYRDYITKHKKYFTLHTIFLAGVFGLLPDIDVLLGMLASIIHFDIPLLLQHGGITHTPLFALLFLIPGIILWRMKKKKTAVYFYVAAFAIFLHLLMDFTLGGGGNYGIMWLFPFTMQGWNLHLINYFNVPNLSQAIEVFILLGWLWHEEIKHKISDFI